MELFNTNLLFRFILQIVFQFLTSYRLFDMQCSVDKCEDMKIKQFVSFLMTNIVYFANNKLCVVLWGSVVCVLLC